MKEEADKPETVAPAASSTKKKNKNKKKNKKNKEQKKEDVAVPEPDGSRDEEKSVEPQEETAQQPATDVNTINDETQDTADAQASSDDLAQKSAEDKEPASKEKEEEKSLSEAATMPKDLVDHNVEVETATKVCKICH